MTTEELGDWLAILTLATFGGGCLLILWLWLSGLAAASDRHWLERRIERLEQEVRELRVNQYSRR